MVSSVAILGGRGQLAFELRRLLEPTLGPALSLLGRDEVDVVSRESVFRALDRWRPEVVINCAAQTRVDAAETEVDTTFAINAQGAGHVADWCREAVKGLVYVSTDHVFGQAVDLERAQPWRETDIPEPVSVYAKSKRAGELETLEKCPSGHVVRTCGLYGLQPTQGKGNFVQTMLRLASQRPLLKVVDDQWCTPSSAKDVARAIIALIDSPHFVASGESSPIDRIWHITNTGSTTWANLAREIFRLRGLATQVESITTAEFNAPAARPAYSILDTSQFTTIAPLRDWQAALAEYLEELSISLAHSDGRGPG